MRKIVHCNIIAMVTLALAGCQTPENPFQTMAEPVPVAMAAPPPPSLPPEDWRPVDAATGQIAEVDALQNLTADFPNSSSVRLRLLNAHLVAEDRVRALSVAQVLVEDGYAFSAGAREFLRGQVQTGLVPTWLTTTELNAAPIEASEIVAEVPASVLLPESVLHDPASDRLLVTSTVSRGLFVRDGEGEWRQVDIPGAGSLGGIALDQRRGLVWVGSGVFEQTPDSDNAFRGMIALDRTTLEVRRRLAAPAGVTISDIAVGPDGTVFGSDPAGGGVYTAAMQDSALSPLIEPGTFRSPQGLAVRPDGRSLVVSDYRYGIAVVTLPARQVYRLQMVEHALLDGVDGLWLHGNQLVAMQNGLSPMRMIAITLGAGPASATGYRVIERNHSVWTEPLGGAISGNSLTYLGTGQWEAFGEGGALADGAEARPTKVHRVTLVESLPDSPE